MNKNLAIFLIICSLTVGGIIVFAANNMSTQDVKNPKLEIKQNQIQKRQHPLLL